MSKIGTKLIELPIGVTVKSETGGDYNGRLVTVTGPKAELKVSIRPGIGLTQEGNIITVTREADNKQLKAYHGLYRSIIANMVDGVVKHFEKRLEIVGVGYRGVQKGKAIELALGFSHKVNYVPSDDIEVKMIDETNVLISGPDKQKVGQTAAEIRQLRKPEPYKGKGVRYLGERVRRKAGKTAAK